MQSQRYTRIIVALFALAALFYNSWPLGYVLNARTARYGLASDLDTIGQPYDWVFILGDVLVGASLLAVSILIGLKLRQKSWPKVWLGVFIGLAVFGLFTATSAGSTSDCQAARIPICASFGKRIVGPDGVESALAALGLLASLVAVNLLSFRYKLSPLLQRAARIMLLAWPASGIWFLIMAASNGNAHLAQQVLLVLSGLVLLVIGLNVNAVIGRHSGD